MTSVGGRVFVSLVCRWRSEVVAGLLMLAQCFVIHLLRWFFVLWVFAVVGRMVDDVCGEQRGKGWGVRFGVRIFDV